MVKIFAMITGILLALFGALSLITWWGDFITVVKGTLPLILILSGSIAAFAAFAQLKDELSSTK